MTATVTLQALFNAAWKHAVVDKAPHSAEVGVPAPMCLYRDGNGGKCLIGAFIPDEAYRPCMEANGGYDALLMWQPGAAAALDADAVAELQACHDDWWGDHLDLKVENTHAAYSVYIEDRLRKFAACHSLYIPEPE